MEKERYVRNCLMVAVWLLCIGWYADVSAWRINTMRGIRITPRLPIICTGITNMMRIRFLKSTLPTSPKGA